MENDENTNGQFGSPAVATVSQNPAHARGGVCVSEASALKDAVELLLIRAEALLDAAESCRCRPAVPNVLVPVHKGTV